MSKTIDLTGERFDRLLVIKRATNNKHGQSMWLCKCDCGKEKIVHGGNLRSGYTKSCGCLQKEKLIQRSTKHGYNKRGKISKIYAVWQNMIQRCVDPNDKNYHHYGGRGITVCKRWRNSFVNFLEDMGEVPKGHQIDRINNDGNYCKSNCRWVTSKVNNRNRRDNRLITYKGKTQLLIEWAEETGIPYNTVWQRIFKYGWSIEKTLTTPVRKRSKRNDHNSR